MENAYREERGGKPILHPVLCEKQLVTILAEALKSKNSRILRKTGQEQTEKGRFCAEYPCNSVAVHGGWMALVDS